MLYQKEGFPEENELVMCTVTNIHFHSVFASLDEYGKTGMIHISEVSPGRIRNIHDFVKEGKKVVCKILRINLEKGHIDLSLRRVNESQRRLKINQVKQEQLCEKIVEQIAKKHQKDVKKLYDEIGKHIFEKYDGLFPCFEQVSVGEASLEKLGVEKSLAKELTEIIQVRIAPEEYVLGGELALTSYAPDGAEIIKQAIKKGAETAENVTLKYKGAGFFQVRVTDTDPKAAEKTLSEVTSTVMDFMKSHHSLATFTKKEEAK